MRYYPNISLYESTTLATWVNLKNSLFRLPLGGGKGGLLHRPTFKMKQKC